MHKKIIACDGAFTPLLENLQRYFENSGQTLHKARNEIRVVDYEGEFYSVKAFKVPHLLNRFIYTFFRDSKAKKSYDYSLKIAPFVPKAIGYIEEFERGLLAKSYFVSEYFDYDLTIREPLLQRNYPEKEAIFRAFAHFTFTLHEAGILHADYSPGNILIKEEETGYLFKIVDINRMVFKTPTFRERIKNFAKLWAKDEDLTLILKEYARLCGYKPGDVIRQGLAYSQAHKDRKNRKKRLKGEKVVD